MTQALRTPDDWYASLFDTTTIDPPARSPGVDLGFSAASESSYASFGPTVAPDPPRRTPDDWYAELMAPSSIDTTARAPSLTGALRQQRPAIPETTRPAGIPAEPMPAFPERSRALPEPQLIDRAYGRFSYALEDANLNDQAFLASINPLATDDDWAEIDRKGRGLAARRRAQPMVSWC